MNPPTLLLLLFVSFVCAIAWAWLRVYTPR